VQGTVFADQNADGLWQPAYEPVLGSAQALISGSGGNSIQASGAYTLFVTINSGVAVLSSTVPSGYQSTSPTTLQFAAAAGGLYTGKNFGFLPPLCSADSYESQGDNFSNLTTVVLLPGALQLHNFHAFDDKDWVQMPAVHGTTYTFNAEATGQRADTVLTLFGPDGVTLLAQSDDNGQANLSSTVTWKAPATGTYLLRVTQLSPRLAGCDTAYSLSVQVVSTTYSLWLPVVMQQ